MVIKRSGYYMELPRRDATPALAKKALSLMARSPRLVCVREPDQLGIEREHPQLAFCVRFVGLGEQVIATTVVEVQVCGIELPQQKHNERPSASPFGEALGLF